MPLGLLGAILTLGARFAALWPIGLAILTQRALLAGVPEPAAFTSGQTVVFRVRFAC